MSVRPALLAVLLLAPFAVHAQGTAGPTQDRDGLGAGSKGQVNNSANSLPSGALNATTGPQSRPAYSSGPSTAANPGAAFVATTPKPALGQAQHSPGTLSTTTTGPNGSRTTAGGVNVGGASQPPK